jgi:predicted RNA-binding Zn-ribbon protein involved in translation (DUF1610 family)
MSTKQRKFECSNCNNGWEEPFGTKRPDMCPECGSENFHRSNKNIRARRAGGLRQQKGMCFGKDKAQEM